MQLLARNLGIPNVVVDPALVPAIRKAAGRRVQLAVSPAGSVELDDAAPATPERGTETPPETVRIEPNLEKLNLRRGNFIRLSSLRASDSGRIVGPKAAKLGELHHHYPEAVADGLAIPFGVFRALLGLPYHDSGLSMFDWMRSQYRALEKLPPGSAERAAASESLRRRIHAWILHADPGQRFRTRLRETMAQVFGFEGTYGVFVRSDTNIEDLPGFSGAGLNLTVPNVVDFDALLKAISRVWASPFSKRAFAWRQGRMQQPEHVYPAVLLMRTVPVQKSGVMVTRDVDSGAPDWLSVAVNEGLGGVVDGQATESLRINLRTGEVRLMAQATMPWRCEPDPAGGIRKVPASGADRVLEPEEIEQLLRLARGPPKRFPPILDDRGKPTAADIEFGFRDGKLALFQIRPFLENRATRNNAYLRALDAGIDRNGDIPVDMRQVPGDTMRLRLILLSIATLLPAGAAAYPLYDSDGVGIRRLEVTRFAQEGIIKGRKRLPGEMLCRAQVDLRLTGQPDLSLPPSTTTSLARSSNYWATGRTITVSRCSTSPTPPTPSTRNTRDGCGDLPAVWANSPAPSASSRRWPTPIQTPPASALPSCAIPGSQPMNSSSTITTRSASGSRKSTPCRSGRCASVAVAACGTFWTGCSRPVPARPHPW